MGNRGLHHTAVRVTALVGAVVLCAGGGCWEKIEYRGQIGTTAGAKPAPSTADNGAASEQPSPAPAVDERPTADAEVTASRPPETTDWPPAADVPETDPPTTNPSAIPESENPATPTVSFSSKRAAWQLGSKFSLAALANDRGIASGDVQTWFDDAKSMASMLDVPLAGLPQTPATPSQAPSREVLGYILEQEKAIGAKLAADQGNEHDALFRLAVRTNLLRMLNTPGSKAVDTLSKSIAELGPRSGLPLALWQPVLDAITQVATSAAIRAAVPQAHEKIEQYLAAEQ